MVIRGKRGDFNVDCLMGWQLKFSQEAGLAFEYGPSRGNQRL